MLLFMLGINWQKHVLQARNLGSIRATNAQSKFKPDGWSSMPACPTIWTVTLPNAHSHSGLLKGSTNACIEFLYNATNKKKLYKLKPYVSWKMH